MPIEKFVRINNRDNFLLDEIPDYYPGTTKYLQFWREQKKRCIEGFWNKDGEDYRFMPGELYFYVNFGAIKFEDKENKGLTKKPFLRDVEWEFFYNLLECNGFSGFENASFQCIDPKGENYVSPREALRMTHVIPLGRPLFEGKKRNFMVLGSRGWGKSYMIAGIMAHCFLFNGADRYIVSEKNRTSSVLVGAARADKVIDVLNKVKVVFNNLPGASADAPPPFSKRSGGSLRPNSTFTHSYEEKVGGEWKTKTGSFIKAVVYGTDSEAGVGGRFNYSVIEEFGLLENAIAVQGANEATLRIGNDVTGITIAVGTGGNVEKIQEAEALFRDPVEYGFLPFKDVYEYGDSTGWFVPYHYSLNGEFRDENGNLDIEAADKFIELERKDRGITGKSTLKGDLFMMSYPVKPSEMFLSRRGNVFPIQEVRHQLTKIKLDKSYIKKVTPIELIWNGDSVIYDIVDKEPLWEFKNPNEYHDNTGVIAMYEKPKIIDGKVPQNMYLIGVDPYKMDEAENGSLGAIYVIKNYEYATLGGGYSQIVAEFVGRPGTRAQFNEILEKMAVFYGGGDRCIYFENNIESNIVSHFRKKNRLNLLAFKPNIFSNKAKNMSGEYGYTITNGHVKNSALKYVADWLLEDRASIDSDTRIRNIDLIYSRALLEEMAAFNDKGNFDRVMGLVGCIIGLRAKANEFEVGEEAQTSAVASFYNKMFSNGRLQSEETIFF